MMKTLRLMAVLIGSLVFARTALADWSPVRRITWTSGGSYSPAVAIDSSGYLHVVWYDPSPGNNEIYYKRSTDGGASWSLSQRLTWTSEHSLDPDIAVDSLGGVHVVWHDYTPGNAEVYYKGSTDGGASWLPSQRLTWTPATSELPAVAVDAVDRIHLIWDDFAPGNSELYYKRSLTGGSSWTPTQRLTWNSGQSYSARIACSPAGHLHVVWGDNTPGSNEIYYLGGQSGGATWSSPKRLTWNSGASYSPAIAAHSSGLLHVVWWDTTPGQTAIYYKNSPDGGATWASARRLTWTFGWAYSPALKLGFSGQLHLVWMDLIDSNWEIFYKKSTDEGATWGSTQRRTWTTSGNSYFPALAFDSLGFLHIVWSDDTPGNAEIYYLKGK
jgi:hypothetical protein